MNVASYCLTQQHRDAGLSLELDRDDHVYLLLRDQVLKVWDDGPKVTLVEVLFEAERALEQLCGGFYCPLKLEKIHCPGCQFVKENLCDWPYSSIEDWK